MASQFKPEWEAKGVMVHESAYIDAPDMPIGAGTRIWHFSHILAGVEIGANCSFGQNVVVGPRVTIGNDCKVQNNVSLYEGGEHVGQAHSIRDTVVRSRADLQGPPLREGPCGSGV